MKQITSVLFATLLVLMLACSSDNPAGPGGTPAPLPYQSESEQIALYYSDSLTPPLELTAQISRELVAIRRSFADGIPGVQQHFMLPWMSNTVELHLTDSAALLAQSGNYHAWDSLLSKYSLEIHNDSFSPRLFTPVSQSPLHPQAIALQLRNLPGVTHASAVGWPISSMWTTLARAESREVTNYYFWIEQCPELYGRVVWIQVRGSQAILRGSHFECSPGSDGWFLNLPFPEAYKKYSDYISYAEATRPAWVDTARAEFRKVNILGPNNEWRSLYQK